MSYGAPNAPNDTFGCLIFEKLFKLKKKNLSAWSINDNAANNVYEGNFFSFCFIYFAWSLQEDEDEDLLTIGKRRKLRWYGHVSRSSGLAKTILQGTVKGGRRQGRRRKRWEDNFRKWPGLEFAKSQRAVENRENGGNWL